MCISLKTKGFSFTTEALILIRGGENRTLVDISQILIDELCWIPSEFTQFLRTRLVQIGIGETKEFRVFRQNEVENPFLPKR